MMSQHQLDYTMDWEYFDRYLLVGHQLGAYDTPPTDLFRIPTPALDRCLETDGVRTVREAANLLISGRAARPEPALFVLSRAIAHGNPATRREALELLPVACRSSAHLFRLIDFLEPQTPLDRRLRAAIGDWYSQRTVLELVNLVLRTPPDAARTHREVLGLADTKPPTKGHVVLFDWIKTGRIEGAVLADPGLELLSAHHMAQTTHSEAVILALLHRWAVLREFLPEPWLKHPAVWRQILPCLSSDALVRWLPRLAASHLLCEGDPVVEMVVQRLKLGALGKGAQAPFSALSALGAVQHGCERHGSPAAPEISQALLDLFHHRLQASRPTGGRLLIAIDPGASTAADGLPYMPGLSPRVALAGLALTAAATAADATMLVFGKTLVPIALAPDECIDTLLRKLDAVPHGPSDGAAPIEWAREREIQFDAFLVLNGSRPKRGTPNAEQALSRYRETFGQRARWLGVSCGAHRLCEAPPIDLDMLEAHGFDATVPALLTELLHRDN